MYAVWDLETTGLNLAEARILELGVAICEEDEAFPLISGSRLVRVSEPLIHEVVQVTHITDQMVEEDGESLDSVLDWFYSLTGPSMPLVGHNILRFDHPILLNECKRLDHPLRQLLSLERLVDTAALYKGRQLGIKKEPYTTHLDYAMRVLDIRVKGLKYNLREAARVLEIETDGLQLHRALGDVELTHQVYRKLVKEGWD